MTGARRRAYLSSCGSIVSTPVPASIIATISLAICESQQQAHVPMSRSVVLVAWRSSGSIEAHQIKHKLGMFCGVAQCSPVHPVDKQLSHVMAAVRGDHGQTYSLKEGGAGLECGKAPLTWMAFNSHRLSCHSFRANDTYYLILWVYLCNVPSPCTNSQRRIQH